MNKEIIVWGVCVVIAPYVWSRVAFGLAYIVGHAKISMGLREAWAARYTTTHGEAICPACKVAWPRKVSWNGRDWICPGCKGTMIATSDEEPFLLSLIECPACFGFWEGLVAGTIFFHAIGAGSWALRLLGVLGVSLYTCATNFDLAQRYGLMPRPLDE